MRKRGGTEPSDRLTGRRAGGTIGEEAPEIAVAAKEDLHKTFAQIGHAIETAAGAKTPESQIFDNVERD